MEKRRNRKYQNNWNKDKKNNSQHNNSQHRERENRGKQFLFNKTLYEDPEAEKKRLKSIREVKERVVTCPICNQPILDIPSAILDKETNLPAHFDCILNKVKQLVTVGENEKVSYIGQGRFAVLHFENPRDQRHFTIRQIVEYEDKEKPKEWRDELSELYSKI